MIDSNRNGIPHPDLTSTITKDEEDAECLIDMLEKFGLTHYE